MPNEEENIFCGCPRCGGDLTVTTILCNRCNISISLPKENDCLPKLSRLSQKDLAFVQLFLESEGNIKEVAELLSISVPSVKKRLDTIRTFLRTSQP